MSSKYSPLCMIFMKYRKTSCERMTSLVEGMKSLMEEKDSPMSPKTTRYTEPLHEGILLPLHALKLNDIQCSPRNSNPFLTEFRLF